MPPSTSNPMNEKSILIIEDDETLSRGLQDNFRKRGYVVNAAKDGADGLDLALTEPVDIILLDVMMPGIDGIETCRRLKASEESSRIPVILVSARDQQNDIIGGLDVGAHDYIAKPVNYEVASARIRSALRIKEYEDSIRRMNSELEEAKLEAQSALKARRRWRSLIRHCRTQWR